MDDPNITIEEYIKLQVEKAQMYFEADFPAIVYNDALTSNENVSPEPTVNMALPLKEQRHLWLRYQVEGNTEEIIQDFKLRLDTIFGRRMRMIYTGAEGHVLFTNHAWRRLFEIRALLVRDFILEFFSTCRISDTELGLDVADTLCFQLGGSRRRMTWKEFFLALGLHTTEDFLGADPSMSEGHFIGRLDEHFGLVSDEGLMGLSVIACVLSIINLDELVKLMICVMLGDTWAWVAPRPERQPIVTVGAPEVTDGAPNVDEGAQAVLAPVQVPQPPLAATKTMPHKMTILEEEVHEMREALGEQIEVLDSMARDFS
nr:hypothetical protein [Tanacetum cinerariifolium]